MTVFKGYNREVLEFLEQIKQNNNRQWFESHYDFYQKAILEPSRDLVEALGEQLQTIAPGINVVPKVNGSIYRFARDARFSKDKTPYKTHLSFLFWQGTLKRTRCPAFFLGIRPESIHIGVGINRFTPEYLQAWRQQCAHPKKDRQIRDIIDGLGQSGVLFHGEQLKRMPRDFSFEQSPEQLLNQDLIRYKGLTGWFELPLPEQVYDSGFVPYCFNYYQQLLPLFNWMVAVLGHLQLEVDFSGQP